MPISSANIGEARPREAPWAEGLLGGVRVNDKEGEMTGTLPKITTLASESSSEASYDNHPIAKVNDHVVRISVMTQPYPWHVHPNSDETFLVVEGCLNIEFEDGTLELGPGQLVTVPRGLRHRTRPVGDRSVNLTFEAATAETVAI
jgi:mannose-6-phosphate isomerase-like protein (cupin superfamily)